MVKKFQSETGLPATGTVDAETWGHLKKSYLYASGKADPSQTIGERSSAVKDTEQALKKLGFKTGAVDGVFDAKTQQAVRAWERKNHKTVNGQVSQAEFNKIQAQEKAASQNGAAAYKTARSLLGKNASWVKTHEPLGKYMPDWVGNTVNCASFVSACLRKNGLMDGHQEVSVRGLADQLSHDKDWKRVSLRDAKPGDVVCFNVGGRDYAHTVMFAGWKNGKPVFIGSNNANADGTQRITQGYMGYPINAIYQYQG
jgi:cell wall-associated NlpC family hydrolase